jgi:hypothetical protein
MNICIILLVYLESNDYAEVEFHQTQHYIPTMDYLGFGRGQPMRLLPKQIPNQQSVVRTTRLATSFATGNSSSASLNYVSEETSSIKQEITSMTLKRNCNVDVDPKHTSDRREWATAHYHAYFNPHCLFELEIRWLVATSCILGDLITNWSQRTGTMLGSNSNQVAFHLIPIPCDPFAEFDPLRGMSIIYTLFRDSMYYISGPIYIKLDSSCLRDQLVGLSLKDQNIKLNIFQELILKRFVQILSIFLIILFLFLQLWFYFKFLCQL